MRTVATCILALLLPAMALAAEADEDGWITLFDGTSLEGWKATEKAESFEVRDGVLCVEDGRSHLFYVGPVEDHDFTNFEFKAEVMTTPGSNSGVFFRTKYQARGWPHEGYEAQVNTTHGDPVKTGSIYHVSDVKTAPSKDNEWFTYHIIARGRHITLKVDGKTVNDYTEPADKRRRASGTFAIQGHDPKSKVYYKDIRVKPLPD